MPTIADRNACRDHAKLTYVNFIKIPEVHVVPNRHMTFDSYIFFIAIDTLQATTNRHSVL
jgi:hypothetical protein